MCVQGHLFALNAKNLNEIVVGLKIQAFVSFKDRRSKSSFICLLFSKDLTRTYWSLACVGYYYQVFCWYVLLSKIFTTIFKSSLWSLFPDISSKIQNIPDLSCHVLKLLQISHNGRPMVFSFLPKNLHFILKKIQFCVCFLKMFRPLQGWYVLFQIICNLQWWRAFHFDCQAGRNFSCIL